MICYRAGVRNATRRRTMTEPPSELTLFPLNAVLFPDAPLRLRIFEPRYLDLVSDCLRNERPFGVCLIREGAEAGPAATVHRVGTTARIVDSHREADGLLGITARGQQRFRIDASRVTPAQQIRAFVTLLDDGPAVALAPQYAELGQFASRLSEQAGHDYCAPDDGDATWVGYRLAELLPFAPTAKQALLEADTAVQRLNLIAALLTRLSARHQNEDPR